MRWVMPWAIGLIAAAVVVPLQTAAQPPATAEGMPGVLKRTPSVLVFAMPGFNGRAFPNAAGGEILLHPAAADFRAVTLQSDVGGPCHSRGHMPARRGEPDAMASTEWRVEATPVSDDGREEATFDLTVERRVPRPVRVVEGNHRETRRVTMRDGSRGVIDFVRAVPGTPGACETFALVVELKFRAMQDDVDDAGLAFDLWLVDRGSSDAPASRTRVDAGQGQEVGYGFAPVKLESASETVRVFVFGAVKGQARRDGLIDLVIDTTHNVSTLGGGRSSSGRKRLAVRPGETIEFELPQSLRAKLPDELRHHDFALRVTASRRW